MNLDNVYVADIEARGLYKDIRDFNDLHILGVGYKNEKGKWDIFTTDKFDDVQRLFGNKDNTIVMHNGIVYDKAVLEKMGIVVRATVICSLALSWYLFSNRSREGKKFGLEAFGEDFGVPKPVVAKDEWVGLEDEEREYLKTAPTTDSRYLELTEKKNKHKDLMKHRVVEDVKITIMLWEKLKEKLFRVYSDNVEDAYRIVNILNFNMYCASKQEMQTLKVDVEKVNEKLNFFEGLKEEKIEELKKAMPKIPVKKIKKKPSKIYKADGSLTKAGEEWYSILGALSLDLEYDGEVEIISSYAEPNPNSVKQRKDWLYSIGWKPTTWKFNRDKITGKESKVEQIFDENKRLCSSVLKLSDKEPAIEALDGLGVISHRIGVLNSFLKNMDEDGNIVQWLQQLAVTLRWQHGNIVNLSRVTGKGDIRDGVHIRECLIPPKGYKIVQSDLSGIESRTSDHYTMDINPSRIEKTKKPYFDAHTEVSVFAGLMTEAEETFFIFKNAQKKNKDLDVRTFSELYKYSDEVQRLLDLPEQEQEKKLKELTVIRSKGKTTNYSSLYLVGAKTLARTLEITESEAKNLIESYWKIHYAVKDFTNTLKTKKVGDETWVFNPISRFWYFVRNEKDLFSTINQSSAVFIFNMWVYFMTKRGVFPVTAAHDDACTIAKEEEVEKTVETIQEAIEDVNKYLKLKVRIDCETQVGDNLSETH